MWVMNPWGMTATSPEKRQVAQEQIAAVFTILEDWFQAIEDGTAEHRLPDPTFVTPPGRPEITDGLVDELIRELDREIDTDALATRGKQFGADASSEFHRLAHPQRVALVQQLMGTVMSEGDVALEAESRRASG